MGRPEISPLGIPLGHRTANFAFTQKDVDRLNARMRDFANQWNKYAKQEIDKVLMDEKDQQRKRFLTRLDSCIYLRAPVVKYSICRYYSQDERALLAKCRDGTLIELPETAIRTAIDVIIGCANSEQWASIVGALQSGKTGVILLLAVMEPVVRTLATDARHIPQINLTRHVDLKEQVHRDAQQIATLLDGFMFVNRNGKPRGFCVGFSFEQITEESLRDFPKLIHRNIDACLYRNTKHREDGVSRGRILIDKAYATTILYCDECHWGNGAISVKATHLGSLYQSHLRKEDPRLANGQICLLVRNFSATPYDSVAEGYRLFYHWIAPGYHGLPYFMGQRCPTLPGYTMSLPEVRTYGEYAKINTPLVYTAFDKYKTYLNKVLGYRNGELKKAYDAMLHYDEWKHYESLFVKELVKVILALLRNGHKGIILRISNVNADAERLHSAIYDQLIKAGQKPYCIMYTSDQPSEDTLLERINEQAGSVLVIVTGGVRMGCRLPAKISAGIDLTWDSPTATAEQQGLFGRLCGYGGKKSLILVSPNGYDSLMYFLKNKGVPLKSPSVRSDMTSGKPGARRQNLFVVRAIVESLAAHNPMNFDLRRAVELFNLIDMDLITQKGSASSIVYFKRFDTRRQFEYLQELSEIVERNPQIVVDAEGRPMFESLDLLYFKGSPDKLRTNHEYLHKKPRKWPYLSGQVLKRRTRTPDKTWIDDGMELLRYLYSEEMGQRLQPRAVASGGEEAFSPVIWINEHYGVKTLAVVLISRTLQRPSCSNNWTRPTEKSLEHLQMEATEEVQTDVG